MKVLYAKMGVVFAALMVVTAFILIEAANSFADEIPVYRGGCIQMLGEKPAGSHYGYYKVTIADEHTRWAYERVHDLNTNYYGPWVQFGQSGPNPGEWKGVFGYDKAYWSDAQYAIGSNAGWRYGKIGGFDAFLASAPCG